MELELGALSVCVYLLLAAGTLPTRAHSLCIAVYWPHCACGIGEDAFRPTWATAASGARGSRLR